MSIHTREAQKEVFERFVSDTERHDLTVVLDNGLYRHLRLRKPGTFIYGFDIVTWPGHLAISGDMGCAVFSRLDDMFEFFRGKPNGELRINTGYWEEKCVARGGENREFRIELLREHVKECFDSHVYDHQDDSANAPDWAADLWIELEELLSEVDGSPSVESAIRALDEFTPTDDRYEEFRFHDSWELDCALTGYTFRYTWRLYAIVDAIRRYDSLKNAG